MSKLEQKVIRIQKMAITLSSFWDFELSASSKIDRLTAISFLKFNRTWQAHFLNHAFHFLKIIITFEDLLLILLVGFDIFHGLVVI